MPIGTVMSLLGSGIENWIQFLKTSLLNCYKIEY